MGREEERGLWPVNNEKGRKGEDKNGRKEKTRAGRGRLLKK